MDILRGKRVSGKTTRAILMSNETGKNILCANRNMRKMIEKQAEVLGIEIPRVLAVGDINGSSSGTFGVEGFIIDELNQTLRSLCGGIEVIAATATTNEKIFEISRTKIEDDNLKVNNIEEYYEKAEKPPLGIVPKKIWEEQRRNELILAMNRYLKVGKDIPREWIDEYNIEPKGK